MVTVQYDSPIAAVTLPVAPAGAHGPGRWRAVAEVADEGGLQPRMCVFATAAFFDYEGNKLPVNAREGVVTRMHSHGRQKYPCIKWHDVAGAAAPYGAVARDPELYVWAAAEAAAVAGGGGGGDGSGAGAGAHQAPLRPVTQREVVVLRGAQQSIGVTFSQLHVRQGRLVVQQVDPHFMPVSGHVRCGDEVVSVDGTPVQAATMAQCIRLLRTAGRHTLAVTTGAGAGAGGGGGGGGGGGR